MINAFNFSFNTCSSSLPSSRAFGSTRVSVCVWVGGGWEGQGDTEDGKKGRRVVQWRMPVTKIKVELHSSSTGVCTSQKCYADNALPVKV